MAARRKVPTGEIQREVKCPERCRVPGSKGDKGLDLSGEEVSAEKGVPHGDGRGNACLVIKKKKKLGGQLKGCFATSPIT